MDLYLEKWTPNRLEIGRWRRGLEIIQIRLTTDDQITAPVSFEATLKFT